MRRLITILPVFCCFLSFAQQIPRAIKMPAIFVDSVLVDSSYYKFLNTNYIENIDIKRTSAAFPGGIIYITTKDKPKTDSLLKSPLKSLADIVKQYVPSSAKSKPIIFLLDGAMLTDTANVRIPALAIRGVTIKKAADIPYFKTALPNIIMMMISTKPPVIMIRGDMQAKD